MIKSALAQTAEAVKEAGTDVVNKTAEAAAGAGNASTKFYLQLILIFAVFYIFLIRPSQVRAKQHMQRLAAVKPGDRVIVGGSILGRITKVAEHEVSVEVANGVEIKVLKNKITEILEKKEDAGKEEKGKDKK